MSTSKSTTRTTVILPDPNASREERIAMWKSLPKSARRKQIKAMYGNRASARGLMVAEALRTSRLAAHSDANDAYTTAQSEPFPSDEPTDEPTLCAQPLASLALSLSSIARVEVCVVCRKREATQTRRGERVCSLCAALYAPSLTPDRLAQARAIAAQPTRIVRKFVNTVTLKDGSVWDDAGRLLIGPYSPPPIEDDDRAASIAVPVIPRRPSGGPSLALAFEKTKEQAKETGERAVMSFILR